MDLMHLRSLLLICFHVADIQCIILIRPEDVITEVGANVSFHCAVNASSSRRRGIRWIYTAERNFRRPNHIYAHGSMFPQWRSRHNVTESSEGVFTLTISNVNSSDIGFYTCMDLSDDSKVTAELTLIRPTVEETGLHPMTISTDETLKDMKQENEHTPETTNKEKQRDEVTENDSSAIALYTLSACGTLAFVLVLVAIMLCGLRRSRQRKVDIVLQSSEENSCEKRLPYEHQTLEDFNEYEVIPDQDIKEHPLHLSGSKGNQYSAATDADGHAVVYVSLTTRETVEQPPVYASLDFSIGKNQSQRHLFTRCCQE